MKTKIKFFMSAIMLLLFVGVFSSCTSDDEFLSTSDFGELSAEDNENIEAIKQFFEKTFPYGWGGTVDFRKRENNYKFSWGEGMCVILNSVEDLAAIYTGDEDISLLDFSKVSIVLCKTGFDWAGYEYDSFSIKNDEHETLVTLNFREVDITEMNVICACVEYQTYKVVPKFKPGKTIRAEVNCIKN